MVEAAGAPGYNPNRRGDKLWKRIGDDLDYKSPPRPISPPRTPPRSPPRTPPRSPPKKILPQMIKGYKYVGCYNDSWDRAISKQAGTVKNGDECAKLAIKNNADVFAIQDNGQCFVGKQNKDSNYKKHGKANNCDVLGNQWKQQVYLKIDSTPKPVKPKSITSTALVCQPAASLGLPKCKDYKLTSWRYPACGERVNVYGKPNFVELNFSIPVGEWTSLDQIKKIPGNAGYTIYGGDGNVSFVFPENCKLRLTINNGPNYSGPVTFVFTKSCPNSIYSGSCGQIKFDRRWTYAQSIRVERITGSEMNMNQIVVRPTTPVVSSDLLASRVLWLDATDKSTLQYSGNKLIRWNDKSRRNNDFSSLDVLQPTKGSDNSVAFNRSLMFSRKSAAYPLDLFIVLKLNNLREHSDIIGISPANQDNFNSLTFGEFRRGHWHNGSSGFSRTTRAVANEAETSKNYMVIQYTLTNNNFVIRRNGKVIMKSSNYKWNMPSNAIFNLGCRVGYKIQRGLMGQALKGSIKEIIAFDRTLNDSESNKINKELMDKHAL